MLALRREERSEVLRLNVDLLVAVRSAGLDPDLLVCSVDETRALADGEVLAEGPDADELGLQSMALGRRLLAEEMTGLVTAQLQMTVEYAKSPTQFGRTNRLVPGGQAQASPRPTSRSKSQGWR